MPWIKDLAELMDHFGVVEAMFILIVIGMIFVFIDVVFFPNVSIVGEFITWVQGVLPFVPVQS